METSRLIRIHSLNRCRECPFSTFVLANRRLIPGCELPAELSSACTNRTFLTVTAEYDKNTVVSSTKGE